MRRYATALGCGNAHVFRIDCGELTDSIQITRPLGSPPGYTGYAETTPLIAALSNPGCVLLVDELDRAHSDLLDLLLGLLDAGRLTTPAGREIDAKHVVVGLTTSVSSGHLAEMLEETPLDHRWAVQRACIEHLRSSGIPADLLARVGAFAFYGEIVEETARTEVARTGRAGASSRCARAPRRELRRPRRRRGLPSRFNRRGPVRHRPRGNEGTPGPLGTVAKRPAGFRRRVIRACPARRSFS